MEQKGRRRRNRRVKTPIQNFVSTEATVLEGERSVINSNLTPGWLELAPRVLRQNKKSTDQSLDIVLYGFLQPSY